MFQSTFKRVFLVVLSTMMAIQSIPVSAVLALEKDVRQQNMSMGTHKLVEEEEGYFPILVNGKSMAESEAATVSYLQRLEFSLDGFTNAHGNPDTIEFFYGSDAGGETEWKEIADGQCELLPGRYLLTYSYNDPRGTTVLGPDDGYVMTVTKAKIAQPEDLEWKISEPAWKNFKDTFCTVDGGNLPQDLKDKLKYTLIVYKDGEELDRKEAFSNGYLNFGNHFSEPEYENGVYEFGVQVSAPDHQDLFEASDIAKCDEKFVTPLITVAGKNGIKSITAPAKSVLLVPGGLVPQTISAEVKDGYQFAGWTADNEHIKFENSASATTTMTVEDGYDGAAEITVYANAQDNSSPAIDSFGNKENDLNRLWATVTDDQEGIKYYAFTTETDSEQVEWTEIETPGTGTVEVSFELTEGGTYYFYAKDAGDNTTKSESGIQVTPVIYHNYAERTLKERTDYIIGEAGVTLATPKRISYEFDGWFTDADCTAEAAESYSAHKNEPYEVYAKWTKKTVPAFTIDGLERPYNGNATEIGTDTTVPDGNVEYLWKKGNTALPEERNGNSSIFVKDVADSGTYTLTIILKDEEGNLIDSKTSNDIVVNITKAPLTVRAENKTISFNNDCPTFTYTVDGLKGSDTKDVITSGTITCNYEAGYPAGEYDIELSGFSADNYEITEQTGKLTVTAFEVEPIVTFNEPDKTYTYTSEAHEPAVTVSLPEGLPTLDPSEYHVEYTNNISAGTAHVTVTLNGNYSGSKTVDFTINKAGMEPTVKIDGWKYGETENEPSLEDYIDDGGTVTYHYSVKDQDSYTTVKPINAGDYEVYATIPATNNFEAVETEPTEFTISKREITIKANSKTFTYDGLAHTDSGYQQTGDGFVPGQKFYSVTVTGSVTDVTADDIEDNNTITYVLTSNTLPGNYDITCVPGTLKVIKDTLAVPFDARWSDSSAGMATWVKVSRKNLEVHYNVELFAYDSESDTYTSIKTVETANNYYSFKEDIRTYANEKYDEDKAYSYFFTVQAVPYKDPAETGKTVADNYNASEYTEKKGEIFTTVLNVKGEHFSSIRLAGNNTDKRTVLNKESVTVSLHAEDGYHIDYEKIDYDEAKISLNEIDKEDDYLYVYVSPQVLSSDETCDIEFHTFDVPAEITGFKATSKDGDTYKEVDLKISARDGIGLTKWAVIKGTDEPEDGDWTVLDQSAKTADFIFNATEPGVYYAYVMDTAGNVTKYANSITIYQIEFEKGDEGAEGTMDSVLKVSDQSITLPQTAYTLEGYSFSNWKGSTGIYADQGILSANPKTLDLTETLTAIWGKNTHTYNVQYYLMDVEGKYPEEPSQTKTFSTIYNKEITTAMSAIQLNIVGFKRDEREDYNQSIIIKEQDQTLKIYYERQKYTLTKRFRKPGEEEDTEISENYYYETDISEILRNKPEVTGYEFVGWLFGDNGNEPSLMPANNVVATGTFVPKQEEYHINYYLQDLNEDGVSAADTYTFAPQLSKVLGAAHDASVSMDASQVEAPEGYSYSSVNVTDVQLEENTVTLPADAETSVQTTASEGKSINVFFTRNTYTATLNVWMGKVNEGSPAYSTSISLLYGATIPEDLPVFKQNEWGVTDTAYKLASYIGWSTGDVAPTTMPAGDITVTRQYVSKVTGSYQVKIYLETATDGTYEAPKSFTFYDNVGTDVSVGNETTDTIKLSSFKNGIYAWEYYELSEEESVMSGTVTDTNEGEPALVLNIYMNRKVITSTISYYVDNSLVAKVDKKAKWGHTYHYDALSIFESSTEGNWTENEERTELYNVSGTAADLYGRSFKNDYYVVAYTGRAWTNGGYTYYTYDYDRVSKIKDYDVKTQIVMGQSDNAATVRYSRADPNRMYLLRLNYNGKDLEHIPDNAPKVPLTYQIEGGKTYDTIYVANEAYFFKDVTYNIAGYDEYPGLANYNKGPEDDTYQQTDCRYVYDTDGELKEGFSKVIINNATYYESYDSETGKYALYIPSTDNQFYYGKLAYCSARDKLGYADALKFLEDYKNDWPDDPYAQGAYVYSNTWGSSVKYDTNTTDLVITFHNGNVYQVNYNLGGAICSEEKHRFAAGKLIDITDPAQFGCTHELMHVRPGYDIVWYSDSGFTKKQTDNFYVNSNLTFYGRYEKSILKNHVYSYYELSDHLGDVAYITKDNVDALMESYPERLQKTSETSAVTVKDELGDDIEVEIVTDTYTFDGNIVMVKTEKPSVTFTEVSCTFNAPDDVNLIYDPANPANVNKAYVQSEAIDFVAYYVRKKVDLFVDKDIKNVNVEQTTRRYGETITLEDPTKNGYEFDGWKWYRYDSETEKFNEDSAFESEHKENATIFIMPDCNFKAKATWKTSSYSQKKYHFYQNYSTRTFDKEAVLALESLADAEEVDVTYNEETKEGYRYANGMVSFTDDEKTYYFVKAEGENNQVTVAVEDLSAIIITSDAEQEGDVEIKDDIILPAHYNYAYTLRQFEKDIDEYGIDDKYQNDYGMIIEHFYNLEQFEIDTDSLSLNGSGTVVVIGGGKYLYGQNAVLKASIPSGYTLVGWYPTEDVEELEDPTIDSFEELTSLSEEDTLTVKVTGETNYTVVVDADDVDEPTLTMSGTDGFVYKASGKHVVSVKADFGEDNSGASYLKSYQWYIVTDDGDEKIEGASGADFTVPSTWNVGEYNLKCVVTVARRDNGMEKEFSSGIHVLTITPDELEQYFETESHVARYDGTNNHAIKVAPKTKKVVKEGVDTTEPVISSDEYTIYYGSEELTEENYLTAGNTENPHYKDVCVRTENNTTYRSFYTVYYYVAPKGENPNYIGFAGSNTVTINPLTLTLSSGEASYSKVYDGSAAVSGDITEEGSDLYKLSHGENIYVVNGLIDGDEKKGYIIDCQASFNSRHVSEAAAVTMSNIVLADDEGNIQYNYIFSSAYTVNLTGYIERRPLELVWENLEFDYDGSEHCPTATLKEDDVMTIDKAHLSLEVNGAQTNASDAWSASAILNSDSDDTKTGDYTLSNGTQGYKINKIPVTVAMVSDEVTYDTKEHTLTEGVLVDNTSLLDGYTFSCISEKSEINAGVYNIKPKSVTILNGDGANATENYSVTFSDAGKLTIKPKEVTVSGITAEGKPYDGSAEAQLDVSNVTFTGIYEGDVLSLDPDKVTGVFVDQSNANNPDAEKDKKVKITYAEGALTGTSADNYELKTDGSQEHTNATISKVTLDISVGERTITYGEDLTFTFIDDFGYSGFVNNETAGDIGGLIAFKVGKTEADANEYDPTLDAGTYNIYIDTSKLQSANYNFNPNIATLTIEPRPITIVGKNRSSIITKKYDGTTDVKTTLVKDTDYTIEGVEGNSASGIVNGDTVDLKTPGGYQAAYDENDITALSITVNNLVVNDNNYKIDNDDFNVAGEITRKTLTITAVSQEKTYGQKADPFTVTYDGFENGEDESVLTGELAFACEYNIEDSENRGVKEGGYTITPSGLSSENYEVVFTTGTLTIVKKNLTVQTLKTPNEDNFVYGRDEIPTFSYEIKGFEYDENDDVVTVKSPIIYDLDGLAYVEVEGKRIISSPSRTYNVVVKDVNNHLSADNYSFTAKSVPVRVSKMSLTIGGIEVSERVYDGTTNVYSDQFDFSNILATGIVTFDRQKWETEKSAPLTNGLFTITDATYNSMHVADASEATFKIEFGEYLGARYEANSCQDSADATIVKRPLTITADDKSVNYGDEPPAYTVTYSRPTEDKPNQGLIDADVSKASTQNHENVDITSDYSSQSDVGDYNIEVSGFDKKNEEYLANYNAAYETGTVKVKQKRLSAPGPQWSAEIGTVTWNAVAGISDVKVEEYRVQLMKKSGTSGQAVGQAKTVKESSKDESNVLKCNFLEEMRAAGAGAYYVNVVAVPSTTNNAAYCNVIESSAGTSDDWYAAQVSFVKADDEITKKGTTSTKITETQVDSYIVIRGEKDIPLTAVLANTSGYTVDSITSIDAITITNGTDTITSDKKYTAKFSLSSSYDKSDEIKIVLKLKARPATLDVVVKPTVEGNNTVTYGYTSDTAPKLKATTIHDDAVPPSAEEGYTYEYTYEWHLKNARTTEALTETSDTLTFPTGKGAFNGYLVRCVVTAKRTDNGETVTVNEGFTGNWEEDNALYKIIVERAKFGASVTMEGWKYGETPSDPVLHHDGITVEQNPKLATPSYTYCKNNAEVDKDNDDNWSSVKPSDVGKYYVRAAIAEDTNYEAYLTLAYGFEITKAKLAKPENLSMTASETASYGKISWDPVEPPKKNNDENDDSIKVTYEVEIYQNGVIDPIKTYKDLTDNELDITSDLQLGATYTFKVKACSSNTDNCDDSDQAESDNIPIGATITATGSGEQSGNTYTQKYNATPVTLTATVSGKTISAYQWYKNGEPIDGAINSTYQPKHVADSGNYTCVVTVDEEDLYTPILKVVITKRSLKIVSNDKSKTYDGTDLNNDTVTDVYADYDGFANGEGAVYDNWNKIINVSDTAEHNNTFTWEFDGNTTAGDYETPVIEYGKLTITPRSIDNDMISVETISSRMYDATAYNPEPAVTDNGLAADAAVTRKNLEKEIDFNYSYANNVNAGENTATVTITGTGNYKDSITKNYTITQRDIEFRSKSESKTYTGQALSINTVEVYGSGLANNTHTHNATFIASGIEVGEYTGTITPANNVTILAGEVDVTSNYNITTTTGKLTITQTAGDWTIRLNGSEYTYNGTARSITNTPAITKNPTSVTLTGTTTYTYSFEQDGTYVNSLSSLTKTDAGEYTVYVKAENPNCSKIATTTAKLKINQKALTVTTGKATKPYDSNPLKNTEASVDGLENNETCGITATGTITDVGSVNNTYELTFAAAGNDFTAKAGNYVVTTENMGTLQVTARPITVQVTGDIQGSNGSIIFDGKKHTASGYTLSTTDTLYDTRNVSCDKTAKADRTNAGTSNMGLKEENFTNSDTNFNVKFAVTDGSITITQKSGVKVKITGKNDSTVYNGDPHTVSDYTWEAEGDDGLYDKDSYFSFTGTASATQTDVGTKYMQIDITKFSNTNTNFKNVEFIRVADGYQTITPVTDKVTVQITGANNTHTYDGTEYTATGYAFSVVSEEYKDLYKQSYMSFDGTADIRRTAAGTTNMNLTPAQFRNISNNFTDVEFKVTDGFVTINQQPVTITVKDSDKVYGDDDPEFEGTVDGLIGQETLHDLVYSRTNNNVNVVGEYEKVLTATYADDDHNKNYDITVVPADFKITRNKSLTVSCAGYSKVYDGNTHTPQATTNIEEGTTIYYSTDNGTSWVETAPSIKDVAKQTVKIKAENANYETATNTYILEVTHKEVTVDVDEKSKIYGNDDPALTFRKNGLLEGDDVTVNVNRTAGETVGTYDIIATGAEYQGNYKLVIHNNRFTINPRTVTLAWSNGDLTYNGSLQSVTATITNKVGTDDVSVGTYKTNTAVNAQRYTAEATSLTGNDSANYVLGEAEYAWEIGKKDVSFEAVSETKVYTGGKITIDGLNIDGLLEGHGHNVKFTAEGTEASATPYTGSITDQSQVQINNGSENVTSNYNITTKNGTLTINPTTDKWTVSVDEYKVTYDGTDHYLEKTPTTSAATGKTTYTYSFSEGGPYVEDLTSLKKRNVGTYTVYVKADNPNYTTTATCTSNLIIEKATLTVSGEDYSKPYDGNTHGNAATVSIRPGTTITYSIDNGISWSETVPTIKDIGKKDVIVRAENANFVTTTDTYTLEVTPAEVTVKAENAQKVYGYDDPDLKITKTGLVGSDDVDVNIRRKEGETVGTYDINVTGDEYQGNYKLIFIDAVFTITRRVIELNWDYEEFIYDGTQKKVTAAVANAAGADPRSRIAADDVRVSAYNGNEEVAAGNYIAEALTLEGADSDNYVLGTTKHTWKIRKRDAVIIPGQNTFVYDGKDHTHEATVSESDGKLTSENATHRDAGSYPVTFHVSETDNYNAGELKSTMIITPKQLDADIDISMLKDQVYNSKPFTPVMIVRDLAINGGKQLVEGQDYTITYENNVNVGTATVKINMIGNYAGTAERQFRITPAPITLKPNNAGSAAYQPLAQLSYEVVSGKIYGNDKLGNYQISTNADNTVAGTYEITLKLNGKGNPNYVVNLMKGEYTVTPGADPTLADGSNIDDVTGDPEKPSIISGKPGETTEPVQTLTETDEPPVVTPEIKETWAIIDLVLTVLSCLLALIILAVKSDIQNEDEKKDQRRKNAKRISVILAIAAVILFILTNDIRNNAVIIGPYTIYFAIALIIQTAVFAVWKKNREENKQAEA